MLGFYPDCPAEPSFTLTRPVFQKASIVMPDGHELVISRASAKAGRARLNGRNKGFRISHVELAKASSLVWK
jgi:putative alpha-1,2-mannosidase